MNSKQILKGKTTIFWQKYLYNVHIGLRPYSYIDFSTDFIGFCQPAAKKFVHSIADWIKSFIISSQTHWINWKKERLIDCFDTNSWNLPVLLITDYGSPK